MTDKIILENVKKKYVNFQLGEISFPVPKGYITGFIGKNGQGKTTTIRSILSLINFEGTILIDGQSNENLEYLQEAGVVMDESFLAKDWNMNLVDKAMDIGYKDWDSGKFKAYLEGFGIPLKSKVKELSRGMKTKLMLSIALSHGARLLVLDEPTSGLDPSMRDEFADIIQDFVGEEDNTVLFSTHITQDLEAIADYIVFIDDGKLVDFDTKEDFIEKYRIVKAGLEELKGVEDFLLGKKVTRVGFEGLVKEKFVEKISSDILVERATIDDIMVLYGRKK
ncbi:MAG: ABC transporter ATP-binding protein [Tissierellia bacterium]|nr:ABC transporter ATP-binding protein [Tissierellia bacterium]